jgi:glycosyltransferase involved in cell wall biosynthesis
MKILFLADGRSATTRSWIKGLQPYDHEIHLISTYPCGEIEGVKSVTFLPLAFSGVGRKYQMNLGTPKEPSQPGRKSIIGKLISRFRKAFLSARYILGPLSLPFTAIKFRKLVSEINPHLIHALRIPYEGMLASYTPSAYPLIISSWGNDFTLHADKSLLMKNATHRALIRANGFMADCQRDLRLAAIWGLSPTAPRMFAPGSGGLDMEWIRKKLSSGINRESAVINPRGIRPVYVRNDEFFQSLPIVLEKHSETPIYCAAMQGELDAEKWLSKLNLGANVHLLPGMPQDQLWEYSLRSRVVVSPAIHDGTPNSVLESMALGCLPVVGDIEPLREWVVDGENGLLVDSDDPKSIAASILRALEDEELYERASRINFGLIQEKADRARVMPEVQLFYEQVVNGFSQI